ncbi:alpha/beta fold hydrolase [Actinoallomurus iriomotensis]|nr:alpha/beta fold hydrolase [Actinoallomurus iriomotensis]
MAWMTVNGVRVFYTSSGDGPRTVVLLHGWCDESTGWAGIVSGLRTEYRVIAPDFRGHGGTEPGTDGFSPFVLADDVAALLDALGVPDAVVVGHSLGGVVASVLAVRRPDLVSALVLLDPAYGREHGHGEKVREWIGDITAPGSHQRAIDFVSRPAGDSADQRARQVERRMRAEAMDGDVIWRTLADLHLAPDQISTRPESSRYLVRRDVPLLAVHADKGRAAWEGTLVRHTSSRVEYWPDVTHWLHLDAPGRVLAVVRDWLADLDEARRDAREAQATTAGAPRRAGAVAGGGPVIDVHVHVGTTVTRSPTVGQSPEEASIALDQAGVTAGILSPAGGAGLDRGVASVQLHNNTVAAAVAGSPERYPVGLATTDLRLGVAAAVAEAERALGELGLAGLCLFPRMSGHRLDGAIDPVLAVLDAYGGLCLMHPADDEDTVLRCAEDFPRITFILAHAPMSDAPDRLRRLVDAGNVYLDTSQNVPAPSAERLTALVDRVGSERLLFAGDSPYYSAAAQREALDAAALPEDVHERIAWRNALSIIQTHRPGWELPS